MKTKILLLAANPTTLTQLKLDEETRAIRQKITMAQGLDRFDFQPRLAARRDDLLQFLNEMRPAILHFSGHGSQDGSLYFQDDSGRPRAVPPAALQAVLKARRDNLRLVVLNACWSAAAADAIVAIGLPVIGMTHSVPDAVAIIFAAALYRSLAFDNSLANAFEEAKAAVLLEDFSLADSDIPQLSAPPALDLQGVFFKLAAAPVSTAPVSGGPVIVNISGNTLGDGNQIAVGHHITQQGGHGNLSTPVTHAAPSAPKAQPAAFRELINQAFVANSFSSFLFDYYTEVRRDFAPGMSFSQQVEALLDHVTRTPNGHRRLADLLAKERPEWHKEYAARLFA